MRRMFNKHPSHCLRIATFWKQTYLESSSRSRGGREKGARDHGALKAGILELPMAYLPTNNI